MFYLLQVGVEQIAEAAKSTASATAENGWSSSAITIAIITGFNLLLILVQFLLNIFGNKKENENYRIRKITDSTIDKESHLYAMMQELSNYTKGEEHLMLNSIITLETYINENRIYLSKKVLKLIESSLDYYRSINTNFAKKDVQKEQKFLDKFQKYYYGQ